MNVSKRRNPFSARLCCLGFLLVLASRYPALAQEVTLRWDANAEPDIVEYRLYHGIASRSQRAYDAHVSAGTVTQHTLSLPAGLHFFAVTAVNAAGLESGFSNEVSVNLFPQQSSSCDLNADLLVNALDVQWMANVILALAVCPASCDLDGNGSVDIFDLQRLVNTTLGIAPCP